MVVVEAKWPKDDKYLADSRWWLRQPNDEIERWVLVVNGNKREWC